MQKFFLLTHGICKRQVGMDSKNIINISLYKEQSQYYCHVDVKGASDVVCGHFIPTLGTKRTEPDSILIKSYGCMCQIQKHLLNNGSLL